jgi:hypothetical protein
MPTGRSLRCTIRPIPILLAALSSTVVSGQRSVPRWAVARRRTRLGRGMDRVPRSAGWFNLRASLANQDGARQAYGGRTEMAKKPYIIAIEEHHQDPEVRQLGGGPGAGRDIRRAARRSWRAAYPARWTRPASISRSCRIRSPDCRRSTPKPGRPWRAAPMTGSMRASSGSTRDRNEFREYTVDLRFLRK